ncbi:MAG: S46 family peptidase [Planctomycetota bacterium]
MASPIRRGVAALLLSLAALLAPRAPAQQELGLGRMWTFHDAPLDYLRREYDFAPDPRWFEAVRLASLRFGNGCSASFVSPHGLILTNHHCARNAIAKVQGANDWVRDGFVAATWADEVPLPGLEVEQLVSMTDVTGRITAGIPADAAPADAARLRKANEAAVLEEARAAAPSLRAQVVALFHGAQFQLYRYRVFDDVRLVMAPHLQVAHFGGDPDNFTYPRHGIDFAFCRAWADGRPVDTAGCSFGWSDGPAPEQLVILTGNPGRTQRLLLKPQLEVLRDVRYPRVREHIDRRLELLRAAARRGVDDEKRVRTTILGYENGQKLYRGEHRALLDDGLFAQKAAATAALRERLAADPDLARQYGGVFDELAEIAVERRRLEGPMAFHNDGGLPELQRALALVEVAAGGGEDGLQRARRLRELDAELQRAFFVDHVERARRWLPPDDPWLRAVLAGGDAAATAARLGESALADPAAFERLAAGGAAALAASDDPALVLARRLWPTVAASRSAVAAVEAREAQAQARLGRALFAVYGHGITPDATFTLRFSDGRVRGYDYNGTRAPWRTVFHGMFARHAEFDGEHPFDLPTPWLLAQDRLDLRAAVDFVCTCDSTGGNSGSPVIDTERRIVGLLFDGNIESLANEFHFRDDSARSVCVHPQAIVEALTKVYDAAHLVRELRREAR